METGPKVYSAAEGAGGGPSAPGPEGGPGGGPTVPKGEWSPGLVEKLTSAERPEVLRWRMWRLLENVLDEGDDWTARILKDRIHSKVTELEEQSEPSIAAFEQRPLKSADTAMLEAYREAERETKAILKFYMEFGGNYMRSRGSGEYLSNTAISPLTVEVTPDMMRTIFLLPGFKTEKDWPQLGTQTGDAMKAYEYIALKADPRLKDEAQYIEGTAGFLALFGSKEKAEQWINDLTLALWAKDLGLEGKTFDELTPEQKDALSQRRVFINRFASKLRPERRDIIKKAIQGLISRSEDPKDLVAAKQAEIAEKLGYISSFILGQAAYYGSEVEEKKGSYEFTLEGYPVSDAFAEIFNPQVWALDRAKSGYFAGPRSKSNREFGKILAGLPVRMHVPFLRFNTIPAINTPDNKLLAKSLWEELWVDGKNIGDISWDRLPELAMRGYLLRAFLLLRKAGETGPAGIALVMRGDDWRGRKVEGLLEPFYWKEVRRWIHIIVGDSLITSGQPERWRKARAGALEKRAKEIMSTEQATDEDGKRRRYTDDEARAEAYKREIKEAVDAERRKWKQIILDSIKTWHSNLGKAKWDSLNEVAKDSGYWQD